MESKSGLPNPLFGRRPVIVHYHIFKNAGSSIDSALRAFFGPWWCSFDNEAAHDIISAEQLDQFLVANPHIRAISSHLARPKETKSLIFPIVFLRHPLLRARSIFDFCKRDPRQPLHEILVDRSFQDFLELVAEGEPRGIVARNYQVVHLSSASFCEGGILNAVALPSHLAEASDFISNCPAVGLVEHFSDSVRLFELIGRQYVPPLQLLVQHENKTGCHENLGGLESSVIPRALRDFYTQNELDLALYTRAESRFRQLREQL